MAAAARAIDLNADLGEASGAEALAQERALLDSVTSANVACGFHAGDAGVMRAVCADARARGVVVGAQVSYRDRAHFGRRELEVAPEALEADVREQLAALAACGEVRYLKPHGALYHRCARDAVQAGAVIAAVRDWRAPLAVLGMQGSELLRQAQAAGLATVTEGFADRGYRADGTLVPRGQPGALITDPALAARQAVSLARSGTARSLCVHSDTPGAAALARAVRAALEADGFRVQAFA